MDLHELANSQHISRFAYSQLPDVSVSCVLSGVKKPQSYAGSVPYYEYSAYLRGFQRADERARTADLPITSDLRSLFA